MAGLPEKKVLAENRDSAPAISKPCVFHDGWRQHGPLESSGRRCRWSEGPNGGGLVVHDVEDRIQPCDLHHVLDPFREIEQLQFSNLRLHARVGTDQMSQA